MYVLSVLTLLIGQPFAPPAPKPPPSAIALEISAAKPNARPDLTLKIARRGARAIPALVALLYNASSPVHQTAQQALRAIVYRASRPDSGEERAAVVNALLAQVSLAAKHATGVRQSLMELLSLVAEERDAPRIAAYLRDKSVRETACLVLTRLPYPNAENALLAALKLADADFQASLLQHLAERGGVSAVPTIQTYLNSPRDRVRLAALSALGSLPDSSSADILWNRAEGNALESRTALRAYLELADRLLGAGDRANALAMYRRFQRVALTPSEQCVALSGIAKASPQESVALLIEALVAPEPQARGLALQLLSENPSPTATESLIAAMNRVDHLMQIEIIRLLAKRQGGAARDAIVQATLYQDTDIRTAGFQALLYRPDIYNSARLQILHRGLSAAQSDEERRVLLTGVRSVAHSSSLPYLESSLGNPATAEEAWRAIVAITDKIALNGRIDEAEPYYRRVIKQSEQVDLVRHVVQKLRLYGKKADVAQAAGYIQHWQVLGALPGRETWRTRDAFPVAEPIQFTQRLILGNNSFRWQYVDLDTPDGHINFHDLFTNADQSAVYAYSEIAAPMDMDVLFKAGSDDDMFCWLNGSSVYRFIGGRAWKADEDVFPVRLVKGVNRILVKVLNGTGGWDCSLRITDTTHQPLVLTQRTQEGLSGASAVAVLPGEGAAQTKVVRTAEGLEYLDLMLGVGDSAKSGDQVQVHIVGTLQSGKEVFNTRKRGEALYFTLGGGGVIRGMDEGVQGMRVGGKRRLIIPPALGYKDQSSSTIPPQSTLVVEVELLSAEH